MASNSLTFDRLAYVDRLVGGGIEEQQARIHAAALETALRDGVATKSDLDEISRNLANVELRLEAKIETAIAGAKVDILRWLIVTQAALGSFIFAALKFMH